MDETREKINQANNQISDALWDAEDLLDQYKNVSENITDELKQRAIKKNLIKE